eukprot:1602572-Amphidinium_carterae.1
MGLLKTIAGVPFAKPPLVQLPSCASFREAMQHVFHGLDGQVLGRIQRPGKGASLECVVDTLRLIRGKPCRRRSELRQSKSTPVGVEAIVSLIAGPSPYTCTSVHGEAVCARRGNDGTDGSYRRSMQGNPKQ